jgi:hypothetical protein
VRTFSLLLRVLCRRPTFVPYASKLAKDSYTQQTKFINRCISASSAALPVCGLDLLAAMAAVDASCAEFLYESIDFTMKAFAGFATNRRKIVMDPATGVEGYQRSAFISLFTAFLASGKYEVKLSFLKMNQFMSPIVSGLFGDSPDRVLSFLNMIDKTILENEQHSKNMAVSFLTQSNTNNLMKLLEYENPVIQRRVLDILTKLSSRQSPSNIIFKVEKLSVDECSCLRNKVLQNILGNLKIFDSIEQLQLSLQILEECPDVVGLHFRSAKFSFEPESSIKWLTLLSFLSKIIDFRPVAEVEIELTPSLEYLLAPLCPPRAALTRAILNDSALVKLYSLQLLNSLLRRAFWCIELIEKELQSCMAASHGIAEMSRRVESLEESRVNTISATDKLIPDIQTLQSLLNLLLSEKEIKAEGDLESQLLPLDWRDQLISLCLDSLQFYARIFISQEDSLGQAQFEDPIKFISPLFGPKELSESLEISILKFASVFPRIIVSSIEAWNNFFCFVCTSMNQKSFEEKSNLARCVFSRILFSTGLFITCPKEIELISFCLNDSKQFSRVLKDILQLQSSAEHLIYERKMVQNDSAEISSLLSKWLKSEISDEMYQLGQKVLDKVIETYKKQEEEEEEIEHVNKRSKQEEVASNSDYSSESESSSDDVDSSSDSDSSDDDSISGSRKLKVLEKRVDFELPDPELTDPAILFSQLLNHIDRDRMHSFILNFPVERRLVPPAQRRRVNDNMLKDLLYGSEDFLLFCNWLGLLAHFVTVVPKDKFDGYTLVKSNLLGAIVMGMSSEDSSMRRVCGHLLTTIHDAIRPAASVQMDWNTEKPVTSPVDKVKQVYSLLCQLRRSIKYDDTINPNQKPSLGFFKMSGSAALYYAEAIAVMIRPDHQMFGPIGMIVHSGAFQSLSGVPLFDNLIRQVEDEEAEQIIERAVFIRQLQWMLKIVQYGCKSRADLERGGSLNKSRVLETIFSLLTIFSASIGKNQESERVIIAILKTLKHLKGIEGVSDYLKNELGHEKWLEMLADVVLKAKTPLNKTRLTQLQELLE